MSADRMAHIADVPVADRPGPLPVHRDYDSAVVGAWRLDLDGIGQLQVALDKAVEDIRDYIGRQERQAIEDAAGEAAGDGPA